MLSIVWINVESQPGAITAAAGAEASGSEGDTSGDMATEAGARFQNRCMSRPGGGPGGNNAAGRTLFICLPPTGLPSRDTGNRVLSKRVTGSGSE